MHMLHTPHHTVFSSHTHTNTHTHKHTHTYTHIHTHTHCSFLIAQTNTVQSTHHTWHSSYHHTHFLVHTHYTTNYCSIHTLAQFLVQETHTTHTLFRSHTHCSGVVCRCVLGVVAVSLVCRCVPVCRCVLVLVYRCALDIDNNFDCKCTFICPPSSTGKWQTQVITQLWNAYIPAKRVHASPLI